MSTQRFGNGKYEVIERLGRGGMAEVYRAHQGNLERDVAIKVLHPFLADDPEFKTRFQKEARNIARLRHPNIVQVYDFENDPDQENYYMVMELVDGPTLKELLSMYTDQGKLIAVTDTVRIIREAASALSYAHGMGMIHRDVKPANLMLDSSNRVVLTDFGIAKIVTGVQFTASGGMVGTPAYMSPEQGLGEQGDERSDLYSLGIIFYQMLTGKLPYDGDTPLAVILKHLNDPVKSPRDLRRELPEELDEIVMQLMAKEPSDRYQTATELIADLERFERTHQNMGLDVPGEASYSVTEDPEQEYDTKALPRGIAQDRHQTPLTGTKFRAAISQTSAARAARSAGEANSARTAPAPLPVPGARRGVPIWLWMFISVLVGAAIYALIWGSGERILSVLGIVPTATVEVAVVASSTPQPTATTPAPTITPLPPSATSTPSVTPTQPSQTPVVIIVSPTMPPSATATASTTPQPPTRTSTATRRPPTLTPSITFTPSITSTATTNFAGTQTAVANIAVIQTATATNCAWDYSEVSRRLVVDGRQISDGAVQAGTPFNLELVLRNTGNCPWEINSLFRYSEGEFFDSPQPFIRIENLVREGTTYTIRFEGTAPNANGDQTGLWELRTPGNQRIGREPIRITVRVFGA